MEEFKFHVISVFCVLSWIPNRNIEEVAYFGGAKPLRNLTYGTKQLLSREIELEKMRRFEMVFSGTQNEKLPNSANVPKNKSPQRNAPKEGDSGICWCQIAFILASCFAIVPKLTLLLL